jgi:hypothetical protein
VLHNGGVNLSAAAPSSLRPLMLPGISLFVKPMKMLVRRPQVTPGALSSANEVGNPSSSTDQQGVS